MEQTRERLWRRGCARCCGGSLCFRRGLDRLGRTAVEQFAQARGAARDLRLGKTDRLAELLGDFAVCVALDVIEPEHAAGQRGEAVERTLERSRVGAHPRRRGFVDHVGNFGAVVEVLCRGAGASAPVRGDLPQPGPERRIAAVLADALEDLEHRVLEDFARGFGVAEHALGEIEHRPLEAPINLLERRRLAAARTLNERPGMSNSKEDPVTTL